jgi:hypothetical protein
MTWFTWRQQRAALLSLWIGAAAVAAGLAYLAVTIQAFVKTHGLTRCLTANGNCGLDISPFTARFEGPGALTMWALLMVPALIGAFFGAPLFAREFEQRTHLLALSQPISRARWVSAKLVVATAGALLAIFVITTAYRWMLSTGGDLLDHDSVFFHPQFEAQGVLPYAYTIMAMVSGIALGLIVRNTVLAMGLTLMLFVAARIAVMQIRPGFQAPQIVKGAISDGVHAPSISEPTGSWVLDSQAGYIDAAGHLVDRAVVESDPTCVNFGEPACAKAHGFVGVYSTYHGPGRYLTFQLIEAGIFLAIAAVLLVAGVTWLRARPR